MEAPVRADTRLEGPALMEDIDILEQAYKTLHPGLYRYNTPAEIDLRFDLLRERFAKGATLAEAYVALAEFGASIRCGHTYPNFFNQPKSVVAALFKDRNRLPFDFIWLDGKMVVTRNLSTNSALAPGTRVVSVNGNATPVILERLMKLARADGSNDAKRRAAMQLFGNTRYEAFDIYFPLCFPFSSPEIALIVLGPNDTTEKNIAVTPLSYEERFAAIKIPKTEEKGNKDAAWKLSFLDQRTALLTMPTWALYNSNWDWQKFLDESFGALAAHPDCALIIDLRDNEGGLSDVGDVILQHLITKDVERTRLLRHVRARSVPKNLIPHLDTWDWSFLDWGTNAVRPAYESTGHAVYYRMTKFDEDGLMLQPRQPHFEGKVVVLMNSENSSATFQFEQELQTRKLGKLIGEPSGGNLRGINGGAFFFLNLPNSKIEMDLPLIATLPSKEQRDMGLIPDKFASVTPQGLSAGKDEVLDEALAYLHRKNLK
jgi:hypothetical protein